MSSSSLLNLLNFAMNANPKRSIVGEIIRSGPVKIFDIFGHANLSDDCFRAV